VFALLFATICAGLPVLQPKTAENTWVTRAPCRVARTEQVSMLWGDYIFLLGGFTPPGSVTAAVERYQISTNTWTTVADMPLGRQHVQTAVDIEAGKLFVLGGYPSTVIDLFQGQVELFIYDIASDSWSRGADLPTPRGAGTSQVVGHEVFIIGGMDDAGNILDTVESYNMRTNTWTTGYPRMPTPREHLASGLVNNDTIVVFGGRAVSITSGMNATESFNTNTGQWTIHPDMPSRRGGLAGIGVGGNSVFAIGGEGDATFPNNEEFVFNENRWVCRQHMPTPRHGLNAVATPAGEIYLIAGGDEPGGHYTNLNEVFIPGTFGGPATECGRPGPL